MMPAFDPDLKLNCVEYRGEAGELTLFDLLVVMCAVVPFAGAMGFAKAGHCGTKGLIVALPIGLVLGVIFAVLLWKACMLAGDHFPARGGWLLGISILIGALCWVITAGWAGGLAEEHFFPQQNAYLKRCAATHTCNTPQATQDLENMH